MKRGGRGLNSRHLTLEEFIMPLSGKGLVSTLRTTASRIFGVRGGRTIKGWSELDWECMAHMASFAGTINNPAMPSSDDSRDVQKTPGTGELATNRTTPSVGIATSLPSTSAPDSQDPINVIPNPLTCMSTQAASEEEPRSRPAQGFNPYNTKKR